MAEEKKYTGYGYHGGGRKKMNPEDKKVYKTISISGTPEEVEKIKNLAKESKKTVSRFVIEKVINTNKA